MRFRLTVQDDSAPLRTDVVVDCEASDPAGLVLGMIARRLPVRGTASVEGAVVDPAGPVAQSLLCEGAVLRFGAPAVPRMREPADGRALVLRAVSGPSAGAELVLRPGAPVVVGRSPSCQLTLDDDDVSRRHAELRVEGDRAVLADLASSNGTWVDGTRLTAPQVLVPGRLVQVGGSRLVLEARQRTGAVLARGEDGTFLVNRRYPDRRRPFEPATVRLPAAPAVEEDPRRFPVLSMLLPLGVAVALAVFLQNPLYLLFGLLSPVMLASNWWSDRRHRQRREARLEGAYGQKLAAARTAVEAAVDDEDADLRRRWADPASVVRIAQTPRIELWSRRPGDDDWLGLRLGLADRPASVRLDGDPPEDWERPMLRRIPVGVDLDRQQVLGLAGPPDWLARRLAWVCVQVAVLHSPDELQVAVLAPGAGEQELGWLRWLPHVRSADGPMLAWDSPGVDALLRRLDAELQRRAAAARARTEPAREQVLVVLVGAAELTRRAQVVELLAQGPALGFRFVATEVDDRLLPDRCGAVLVAEYQAAESGEAVLRADRADPLTVAPDELDARLAERLARGLAPLRRVGDAPAAAAMPSTVRFGDLAGIDDAAGVGRGWRSQPPRTEVVIGADGEGPVVVDIARDGPHAVVAGTSGAGKSELLQTLIIGLALANDPEQLDFIFMDYKGGATFKDLVALPHVVGSVTNLDERLAVRALASLRAELNRRQAQLAEAGAGSLAEYRRLAATHALAPFPRLVIVVDELAEMKDQLPTLVDGLVNVARVGRSLGVHLVLATQKPAGVVDAQIRANVDLRICLRVAGEGDSVDVIDVPDAARIPKELPGRALLVRGGAAPVAVQTARVTTPHRGGAAAPRGVLPLPWKVGAAPPIAQPGQDGPVSDLQVLVDAVAKAAASAGLTAPYRPWVPPLPPVVTVADLLGARTDPAGPAMALGLRDLPAAQRQEPLLVSLGSGHVAVVGSARTGRTSALRAIAAGLAAQAPPEQLHLHVIDGSGGLAALAGLPHTGVVVGDDPPRLERLLTRLVELVRERRRRPPDRAPQVMLLVDGWDGLADGAETPAHAALFELLAGGLAAGVTVAVAGDERLLRGRVLNRFAHRLCLRLNNPADGAVMGLDVRHLPAGLPPGRGLWAEDGSEVQVPLLAPDPTPPAQHAALDQLVAALRGRAGAERTGVDGPLRLDALPDRVAMAEALRLPGPAGAGRRVLLGVGGDRLAPRWADLGDGHVLVAGPHRSGRSTAAATIAASAALGGLRTVLAAPRPAAVHERAAGHGVVVVPVGELGRALDAGPWDLVVVDDADQLAADDPVGALLGAAGGPALVVSALLESFGFGARGLVKAVRPGPHAGVVLLCPPNHLVAADVGVSLERGAGFAGPPGRAYLVAAGETVLGQVPEPG